MTKYKAIKVDGVKHDYHRWLMEQELGRKLRSDEVVHHINENKLDNDINNLEVLSKSEHARLHAKPPYFTDEAYENSRKALIGHKASNRKLKKEDIEYIKEHYMPRDRTYGARALGRKYGVDRTTILGIVKGILYKNFD